MATAPSDGRWLTGCELAAAIQSGELTSAAALEAALARCAAVNPAINAVVVLDAEAARAHDLGSRSKHRRDSVQEIVAEAPRHVPKKEKKEAVRIEK